jgi:hypothetical protein
MILLNTDDLILDLEILAMIIEVILVTRILDSHREMSATHDTWTKVLCLLILGLLTFFLQAEILGDLMMIQECCHHPQQSQPREGHHLGTPWTIAMKV